MLIEAGADVEALNEAGWTPLWVAVRYGHREKTAALLEAGADPWRIVLGERSAGRIALDGPLADLFEHLPGAPVLNEEEQRLQDEADELIEGFYWLRDPPSIMAMPEPWARTLLAVHEFFCAAFVKGPDEDEVIRRMGADPSACPLWTPEEAGAAMGTIEPNPEESFLWVGTPPSGGVMTYHGDGILPVNDSICSRVTGGGGLLASVFAHNDTVNVWRDGTKVGWPDPFHDPWPGCPEEAWRCRFGDHAHDSYPLQRSLALMTVLTGVHVEPEWFVTAPKRAVRLSEPPV